MTTSPLFVSAEHGPTLAPLPWTGRLEVQVIGFNGYPVGLLSFVVRADTVSIELAGRNLAVHDREDLRHWLTHPFPPFDQDDVVWSSAGTELRIALDRSTPYVLPDWFVSTFGQVV